LKRHYKGKEKENEDSKRKLEKKGKHMYGIPFFVFKLFDFSYIRFQTVNLKF